MNTFTFGLSGETANSLTFGLFFGVRCFIEAIAGPRPSSRVGNHRRESRHRSEFGIRLALGATRVHIQTLVVGQTVRILLAGIGPGLLLSAMSIRLARYVLYGSIIQNSFAALAATIVLVIAGSGAAFIPARRAALADPLETLRQE